MKHDILADRKGIHLKMDKVVHAKLRARLFMEGLSMQEVIEEFIAQYINGSPAMDKIISNLVNRKINNAIQGLRMHPKRSDEPISELDRDRLYNLINDDQEEHDDEIT